MAELLLTINDLHVSYGSIEAVKGIDLQIYKGQVVALLGANGAGKTTTLRTISGLIRSQSGSIYFKDQPIHNMAPEKITALGISQSPEGRAIFPDLTVEENLKVGSFTVKSKDQIHENFDRVYRYFPILKERKHQLAATLSGGEQQMLAIGRALMSSPELLLLDEPSLGLAPLIVQQIFQIIEEIKREGTTVLIVEQNALQTLKIADYAYVLEVGRMNMEGKPEELIKNPKLIESYLGGTR